MNQELRNRIAEVAITIAMLIGAWFILAGPAHSRVREARETIAKLENEASQYESIVALPQGQAEELHRRIASMLSLAKPRPALEHRERILSLAHAYELEIERINPAQTGDPSPIGPFIVTEHRINIQARGHFADVASFLSELMTESPMVLVESFAMSPPDHHSSDAARLSASIRIAALTSRRTDLVEARP